MESVKNIEDMDSQSDNDDIFVALSKKLKSHNSAKIFFFKKFFNVVS